eukprot:14732075-Alexandrium_andersonii.AAC.1
MATAEEALLAGIDSFKVELAAFYHRWDAANRPRTLTRVTKLSAKKFGTRDDPQLKLKAMETLGVALYLADTLPGRLHLLGPKGPQLVEAGNLLLRFREVVNTSGPVLSPETLQLLMDLWKRFMNLSTHLGI